MAPGKVAIRAPLCLLSMAEKWRKDVENGHISGA